MSVGKQDGNKYSRRRMQDFIMDFRTARDSGREDGNAESWPRFIDLQLFPTMANSPNEPRLTIMIARHLLAAGLTFVHTVRSRFRQYRKHV
jgi:hypothetical protein